MHKASAMHDFEDSDKIVEKFSTPKPFRPEYSFRVQEIPKADRVLEIEVQVLEAKSDPPSNPQPVPKQDRIVGKAFMRVAESRDWEATLELMQADTAQGFLNLEIPARLLRCIHAICTEKHISHLKMVDIDHVAQKWYRDFFRLAGFQCCRCPGPSAGSSTQQDLVPNQNCLNLCFSPSGRTLDEEEPSIKKVHETPRTCLAEDQSKSTLPDSTVASGKAVEVERKHSHNIPAPLSKGGQPSINARKWTLRRTYSMKLSQDILNQKQKDTITDFDSKGFRKWFQGFLKDCPSGIVPKEEFQRIYEQSFPFGDPSSFAD